MPWMVMLGVLVGNRFRPGKSAKKVMAVAGGLALLLLTGLCFVQCLEKRMYLCSTESIITDHYLMPMLCIMIGAGCTRTTFYLHKGKDVAKMLPIAVISLAVYLATEYLIHGWTFNISNELPKGWAAIVMILGYISQMTVSLCLAGLCRSRTAFRMASPSFVKFLMLVLCAAPVFAILIGKSGLPVASYRGLTLLSPFTVYLFTILPKAARNHHRWLKRF